MAQISDLVAMHCLVWNVEKPYQDVHRKSSNFSLLGYEWKFEMYLYNQQKQNYYSSNQCCYKIYLQKVTDQVPLKRDLTIRTFFYGRSGSTCLYSCNTGRDAMREIWMYAASTVDSCLGGYGGGKCRITFEIEVPCMIQLSRSETGILYTHKCVQASPMDILPGMESLSHDFSQLLGHKSFSDVQLRCGDRSIHAHKMILASRSDVFAAMFRNKMVERKTGIVNITDMDADVFDLFLKYVYSGSIPELSDDTVSSLYAAGDKYSIHGLKKTCADWMVGRLTKENCLGFLILAEAHSDEGFKDRVASFVAENLESLEKQPWLEFSRDHSALAFFVYHKRYNGSTPSE